MKKIFYHKQKKQKSFENPFLEIIITRRNNSRNINSKNKLNFKMEGKVLSLYLIPYV